MTSSLGVCSALGAWAICPRTRMIPVTITVSPANTYRQLALVVTQPPISGPAATATAVMPPISA